MQSTDKAGGTSSFRRSSHQDLSSGDHKYMYQILEKASGCEDVLGHPKKREKD